MYGMLTILTASTCPFENSSTVLYIVYQTI